MSLDDVNVCPSRMGHLNCEYGKARAAIESEITGRPNIRTAKLAVIKLLGGELVHPENTKLRKYVVFPDNTKAVF